MSKYCAFLISETGSEVLLSLLNPKGGGGHESFVKHLLFNCNTYYGTTLTGRIFEPSNVFNFGSFRVNAHSENKAASSENLR
jgi:hypothetical protein